MGFIRFVGLWALACSMLVACGDDAKKLHVSLVTDLSPGAEFASVDVLLTKGENEDARRAVGRATQDVTNAVSFARGRSVADFEELATGHYTARLSLVDRRGERVATTVQTFNLQGDRAITVTIERACVNVICPIAGNASATACRAGRCVEPECADDDTTNDERCPVDLICDGANDCPDVAMCADRACIGGYCIPAARAEACEDETYCDARTGCEPVTPPGPSAPRGCNTVCRVDNDGCVYGYLRCIDDTTSMCSQIVRRPVGTPCAGGGVCDGTGACVPAIDVDAGVDADVDDAAVDATIDAAVDASLDASVDAAPDMMPDAAVPTLVVENVGPNGLVSEEFDLWREAPWRSEAWSDASAHFSVSISGPFSGPLLVEASVVGADPSGAGVFLTPAPCAPTDDASLFTQASLATVRFRLDSGRETPLETCVYAWPDRQKTGDRSASVRFRVIAAPSDPSLLGAERVFDVTHRDTTSFRDVSVVGGGGLGIPATRYAVLGSTISRDGESVVFGTYPYDDEYPDRPHPGQLLLAGEAYDDEPVLLTVDGTGMPGNAVSHAPALSGDGRFVAFLSAATNFVSLPDGSPPGEQVYVLDRMTGQYELISGVYAAGVLTEVDNHPLPTDDDDWSFEIFGASPLTISADGRYVAFQSFATNLVLDVPFPRQQIYVFDRATKTTELASVDELGDPIGFGYVWTNSSMSADGRHVAFATPIPGSIAGVMHTFVRDLETNTTTAIDTLPSGDLPLVGSGHSPRISGDGEWVFFWSLADLTEVGGSEAARLYRRRTDGSSAVEIVATSMIPASEFARTGVILSMHVSFDGSNAIYTDAVSDGFDMFLWDASSPSEVRNLTAGEWPHREGGENVTFLPHGFAEPPSDEIRLLFRAAGQRDVVVGGLFVGDFPRP